MGSKIFVSNALPTLEFSSKPVVSFHELMTLFEENFSERDMNEVKRLRLYYDLSNLERFFYEEDLDPRAQLDTNQLRDEIVHQELLPDYVFDFLNRYSERQERLDHFHELITTYYFEEKERGGVASDVIAFERRVRLFTAALRGFERNIPLEKVFALEDCFDDDVEMLLQIKRPHEIDMGDDFAKLRDELSSVKGNPFAERRAVEKFRFNHYSEWVESDSFTLRRCIAFMMQLIILEDIDGSLSGEREPLLNIILKDSA